MNVSSSCIDACSFHLDMDNIMDRPECMNDFDKLMKCAADGSGKIVFFFFHSDQKLKNTFYD